jgi:hypothetical protein
METIVVNVTNVKKNSRSRNMQVKSIRCDSKSGYVVWELEERLKGVIQHTFRLVQLSFTVLLI